MHHFGPHQLITKSSAKPVGRLALIGSWIGLSVGLASCAEAPDPVPGTGGATSGGAAAGGTASGGVASGGAPSGGAASGGAPSGGAASGGAPSGGGAGIGGTGTGGETPTGGGPSGGAGTGGDAATGGTGTGGAASSATFEDVSAILTARCATNSMCHGAGTPRIEFTANEGLYGRITTMDSARCANNKFVTPSDSATSAIVMAITGEGCTRSMGGTLMMPPNGGALPAEDIQTIEDWIDAGAPE